MLIGLGNNGCGCGCSPNGVGQDPQQASLFSQHRGEILVALGVALLAAFYLTPKDKRRG